MDVAAPQAGSLVIGSDSEKTSPGVANRDVGSLLRGARVDRVARLLFMVLSNMLGMEKPRYRTRASSQLVGFQCLRRKLRLAYLNGITPGTFLGHRDVEIS